MVAVRLNAYLKWEKVEKESEKRVIIINVFFFSSTGKVDGDFLLFFPPCTSKEFSPNKTEGDSAKAHTKKKSTSKKINFPLSFEWPSWGRGMAKNWGHEMGPTRQVCCRALNWTKNCVSCREPPRRKLQIISSIDFDKNLAGRVGFYTTLRLLGFGKVTWIGGKKMRAIEHL